MKSKLSYIIPLHKTDDRVMTAINSVLDQTEDAHLVLVSTDDIVSKCVSNSMRSNGRISIVTLNDDQTSYQELVNAGIDIALHDDEIEWVSFLEFDDKLLPGATSLFMEYREANPDFNVFAGLTLAVEQNPDDPNGVPNLKSMLNEGAWAPNIMETRGVFDFNAQLRMNFVFINGCFFKVEIFNEIGLLKPNMKFFHDYELALRVIYNGNDIRAIPKATHYHFVNGEAISSIRDLPRDEGEYWSNAARKEYFFEFDREISYDPGVRTPE